jgi:hypothetical protein
MTDNSNNFDNATKTIYQGIFYEYSNLVIKTMFNQISRDINNSHYWFFGTTKPTIYRNLVEEFSWDPRRKDVVCLSEKDLLEMKNNILKDLQHLFPDHSITMDSEYLSLEIHKKS